MFGGTHEGWTPSVAGAGSGLRDTEFNDVFHMFCRDLDCCITLKVTLDKQWTAWSWVFQGRSDRKGGDRLGRSGGTGHDHPVFQRLCRDQNLWFELQGSGCFSGTGQERFLFGSELVGRVLQNRYEEKSWGRKVSMTGGVVSNLERHKCHMGYHYVLIRIDILRCTSHLDTKWWKPTWKSIAFFFCVCVCGKILVSPISGHGVQDIDTFLDLWTRELGRWWFTNLQVVLSTVDAWRRPGDMGGERFERWRLQFFSY